MKFPQFIGLKLPTDVVELAKQKAEADDRTLSAYLRRIIIKAVALTRFGGRFSYAT